MSVRFAIIFLLLLVVSMSGRSALPEPAVDRGAFLPIIPYIFFDSASADPARYHRFTDPSQTAGFDESSLNPELLDVHHELLNIIGSRMRKHPKTTISIIGCSAEHPLGGESVALSKERGEVVYRYLVDIWGIAPHRVTLLPERGLPAERSNPKDPRGMKENRRAEILSDDWELIKPVYLAEKMGERALTIWLVRFKFDSPEMGPLNERIMKENAYPAINGSSSIQVIGYSDDDRLDDRGNRLPSMRVERVAKAIRENVSAVGTIETSTPFGVGLCDWSLPEGTMHSRAVQVVIR